MNIKNILVMLLVLLVVMLSACSTTLDNDSSCEDDVCSVDVSASEVVVDKLEIYHFHATNQCISCITLGDFAEKTVNAYFKDELDSGLIVFDHINIDLPENKELVLRYGATGSSLWLGTYQGDSFVAEENTAIWYKLKNEFDYTAYLKGVIDQKLAGN